MALVEIIKEKNKTVYQQLAEKHGASANYVGKIARGQRIPKKKKGLAILKDLQQLQETDN